MLQGGWIKFQAVSGGGEMDHSKGTVGQMIVSVAMARLILICPNMHSMRSHSRRTPDDVRFSHGACGCPQLCKGLASASIGRGSGCFMRHAGATGRYAVRTWRPHRFRELVLLSPLRVAPSARSFGPRPQFTNSQSAQLCDLLAGVARIFLPSIETVCILERFSIDLTFLM